MLALVTRTMQMIVMYHFRARDQFFGSSISSIDHLRSPFSSSWTGSCFNAPLR